MIDIADEATPDDVNVARLRIDTRKWVASKLLPKVYGERSNNEINVSNTIQNITVIPAERMKELQEARREALGE